MKLRDVSYVTEVDPICFQACMEEPGRETREHCEGWRYLHHGYEYKDIIMAEHLQQMKNNAIVGNIGHFDNEIDMLNIQKIAKREDQAPGDRFVFTTRTDPRTV